MRSGTLLIRQSGQFIEEGDPVGKVGNAGQTSKLHLHIHAVRDVTGNSLEPIPMSFNGKVLSLNSIITR